METCDVCKLEFPSSKPNEATVDAKIQGLGLWGYLCRAHEGYAVPGTVYRLEVMNDAVDA